MRVPTVHLNGTNRAVLVAQLENAVNALRAATDAVAACNPNGRDYYTQGESALVEAQREHASRLARLLTVRDELSAIWEAIVL